MRMVLFPTQLPEAFMISRECLMMNGSVFPFRYLSQRRSPQQNPASEKSNLGTREPSTQQPPNAAREPVSASPRKHSPDSKSGPDPRFAPKGRSEGEQRGMQHCPREARTDRGAAGTELKAAGTALERESERERGI